ncbi:MAG: valine--pyruvate transaminase [Hahellaceae bacterium]|nr:valine--pyruvate transaminase [Hahellaceae bacterium]
MKLSAFGEKFTANAGITSLMDDLGNAMSGDAEMVMMGGGNPGYIPAIHQRLKECMQQILDNDQDFHHLVGVYDPPQGEKSFISHLVRLLNNEFGWKLSERNIALTNGSQSAFFLLFNMFAGEGADGVDRVIQLPMAPEYIGYADAGLAPDFFHATRPVIQQLDEHLFKYRVDFDKLSINENTGAICVSRPTNPTGNVITDDELQTLDEMARARQVPLIIDGAYGTPFPNLIFSQATPCWNENIILCLSLSKFGMPAARTGIVIAREDIIKALSSVNAIVNLTTGSFGAMLARELVRTGEILRLSNDVVRPFYQAKALHAQNVLNRELKGYPFMLHKPEGAMFLWLWLPGLPVSSQALYERLKAEGVLVVSGHYFFPGLKDVWQHSQECIRITYSQDDAVVERGLMVLGSVVRGLYDALG